MNVKPNTLSEQQIAANDAAIAAALADEAAGQDAYEARKAALYAVYNTAALYFPDDDNDATRDAASDELDAALGVIQQERDNAWCAHFAAFED